MHRQLLILLFFVPFIHTCFNVNSGPDQCQCEPIQYIDQAGIRKLEYGSYLANRTTTRPNVTVTDSCQILVDVSKLETDNHYLMVFRDGAPPIFAKRLSNLTDKVIELADITCVQVGKEYKWQYFGGTVSNLSVTVQSNEEMCGCNATNYEPKWTPMVVDPARCDSFSVNCTVKNDTFYIAGKNIYYLAYSPNSSAITDDLTCVSGQWYYNNAAIRPKFECTEVSPPRFQCGCGVLKHIGVDELDWYTLDPKGRFANYTLKNGSVTYDECSAELKCTEGSTLVIFSANFEPMIYPPGTEPNIMCAYTPLKSSPVSLKYWFVDGVMLSDPYFGCYVPDVCPCSFAFLAWAYYENYLGSHPLFNNFTAENTLAVITAKQPVMNGVCPETIDCIAKALIFDTKTAVTFPEDELVNVSCSETTKNWTVNGRQFDQLYSICVFHLDI